jgi:hypothetical protein
LDWEGIALDCNIGGWIEESFHCSLSEFGDVMKDVWWVPFEGLLYEFCVGVVVSIVLDRPFPFVLMVGRIFGKAIVDSEGENSEKFGNNNAGSNVPRAFARI